MNFTELGDKHKFYENKTRTYLYKELPVMVRLDGKAFHNWTRGLDKPYDINFRLLMANTTAFLIEEFNARLGYTQSDEISLILFAKDQSELIFGGSYTKLVSVISSYCTEYFNRNKHLSMPAYQCSCPAYFDCRVWQYPTIDLCLEYFLWRELDCIRNSITSAAKTYFSHNQLQGVNSSGKQELLHSININWNDYPCIFKRGTYVQRRKVKRKFTNSELCVLPARHKAHSDPNLEFERTDTIIRDETPIFSTIVNQSDFVLYGQKPCLK